MILCMASPETQTGEIGWPVQTFAEGTPTTSPAFWEIGGKVIEGHIDLTALRGLDPGPKVTQVVDNDMNLRKRFFQDFKAEYNLDPKLAVGQVYFSIPQV